MYCSIQYTHDMPVIFLPLEALFLLNLQLEILSFIPLGSTYFWRRNFLSFTNYKHY